MSAAFDINTRLCDLLGVNWRSYDVKAVTVRLSAEALPSVTVERELFPMGQVDRALRTTTERYTLQPAVYDPDAMVAAARSAVALVADKAARRESAAVTGCFARAEAELSRNQWLESRGWMLI